MIFKRTLNLIFTLLTFIVVAQNKVCESSEENILFEQNTIGKCLIHDKSVEHSKNHIVISTRNRVIRNRNNSYIKKLRENKVVAIEKKEKMVSNFNYAPYSAVQHIPLRLLDESVILETYINENVVYPFDAAADNIQGKVFVRFIVDKEGYIKDLSSYGFENSELLQEEVKRVIKSIPKIIPIELNHKVVNAEYYIPLVFTLD